jgi:cobalamin biosynthesis Mg chelatase CobN
VDKAALADVQGEELREVHADHDQIRKELRAAEEALATAEHRAAEAIQKVSEAEEAVQCQVSTSKESDAREADEREAVTQKQSQEGVHWQCVCVCVCVCVIFFCGWCWIM